MDVSSRPITDGCLYTVKQRLETFTDAHWPYEDGSCTPIKMAEAGFYYCGNTNSPDWVRCFVCHHELDGWEDGDIPRDEHARHSKDCPFIKTIKDPYTITVGQMLEIEKSSAKIFINKQVEMFKSEATEYCEGVLDALRAALDDLPDNTAADEHND